MVASLEYFASDLPYHASEESRLAKVEEVALYLFFNLKLQILCHSWHRTLQIIFSLKNFDIRQTSQSSFYSGYRQKQLCLSMDPVSGAILFEGLAISARWQHTSRTES